jgi:hypothetical protein
MKRQHFLRRKILSSVTAGLLVLSFVSVPFSHNLELQKADAADAVVEVGPSGASNIKTSVESTISAISDMAQAGFMSSLNIKEYSLDGIAWALTNILLKEMIRSTTKWVNSGFQGSPAFVTDLGGFMTDIGDRVAGNFIYGSGLSMICSPFKLNIQLALDIQYRSARNGGYQSSCRLSQVVKNMDNFINGNFKEGGWNGWAALTLDSHSNPYTTGIEANAALGASITNARGEQIKLLEFGRGFLSMKDANGKVTTPGVVIENTLNNAIGGPQRRLEVADEFNELVGALFSQLAGEVLGGVGGLLGLTESSHGSGNYFDRVSQEANGAGNSAISSRAIQLSIQNETRYLSFETTITDMIIDASTYQDRVYGADRELCATSSLTNSLANRLSSARREATSTRTTITTLNTFLADYNALQSATATPTTTRALLTKYRASSTPQAQSNLMSQYLTYEASGIIHNTSELVELELTTIPALRDEIVAFTTSIDASCRFRGRII